MTTMNFILDGRDRLSEIFDRAGDASTRMHRRISAATTNSSAAINRFHRTAATRLASLSTSSRDSGEALDALKKTTLSLAPAIIPAAAAMAPLVASTAAAGVAVGVYAAALGPQIAAMSEASEAEKKYTEAVKESGRTSKEAVAAESEYLRALAKLPPETRRAAVGVSILREEYKAWSDSLATDTMAPFNKGLAIAGGLLPKLTPMVRGTSSELDRMMTIVGGSMESPGLDRLIGDFTQFSTGVLRRVNDGLVHFLRTLDTGQVGGSVAEFMQFARENGPVVGEVLRNIGKALMNLLIAGADVGVGMLQVVNAIAALVAAVPPSAITALLQLAIAIKAAQLAALGLAAAKGAIAAFGTQLVAMQAAAAGAPGRLAAVSAAIGALSKAAKIALAGTAIGLLVIAIGMLATRGKDSAPDVDKLTTSLGKLGDSGKVGGEAARAYGKDLDGLAASLRSLARPDNWEKTQGFIAGLVGMDSGRAREWKKHIDGIDQALANLVKGGKPELAKAALEELGKGMEAHGLTQGELRSRLDAYNQALADQAFEAKIAAQAQGLFGQQAQQVSTKLAAQKQSADGLRQSIQALNDVQRAGLGGMIGFEAAIDAASAAAKENAGALTMTRGQLNLNTEKSRTAASALNDLAAKTDAATGAARDNGASWSTVNGIYQRGRGELIKSAMQMGLTRDQAKRLADQILKTPDKTARLKGNMEDLQSKLVHARNQLARVPDSRKASVRARIDQLNAAIREAKRQLDAINGKTSTTYVVTQYSYVQKGPGPHASGYVFKAQGGLVGGLAGGGPVRGPGTSTSDSILTALSNGEFVHQTKAVDKYGLPFMEAINEGRLALAKPSAPTRMAPTRPAAVGRAGGAQTVNIQIDVHGAADPMAVGREFRRVLLELKRTYGVNVSLGVG